MHFLPSGRKQSRSETIPFRNNSGAEPPEIRLPNLQNGTGGRARARDHLLRRADAGALELARDAQYTKKQKLRVDKALANLLEALSLHARRTSPELLLKGRPRRRERAARARVSFYTGSCAAFPVVSRQAEHAACNTNTRTVARQNR